MTIDNSWIAICHIDDIPVLGSRRVERPQGAAVALFRYKRSVVHVIGACALLGLLLKSLA